MSSSSVVRHPSHHKINQTGDEHFRPHTGFYVFRSSLICLDLRMPCIPSCDITTTRVSRSNLNIALHAGRSTSTANQSQFRFMTLLPSCTAQPKSLTITPNQHNIYVLQTGKIRSVICLRDLGGSCGVWTLVARPPS